MSQTPKNVYLDVCALSRPFDDQAHMRIRLETEAVQLILSYVHSGYLNLVVSPVHTIEIEAIDDLVERQHLLSTLQQMGHTAVVDTQSVRKRAEELVKQGIGIADAAHLAFAEAAVASFITCDDRLVRQCKRVQVKIWFGTPVAFCVEEGLE